MSYLETEGSQTEKDRYHITYMWNVKKKKYTNELTYETEIVTDTENKLRVTMGYRVEG